VTPINSRFLRGGAVILCLTLPVAVPLSGNGLQQPPPPSTTTQRPPDSRAGGPGGPPAPGSQRPGGGPWEWEWWKDAEIQKNLGLTEAKAKMIGRIYDDRVKRVQPIVEKFQSELKELEKMASERQVSVEVFALQVTAVEALRSELSKSRTIMNYRISRELTPEQNTKLAEIRDKRFGGGRGGRGGDRQK